MQTDASKLRGLVSMPSLIDTIRLRYWTTEGPDTAEVACCGSASSEDIRALRKGLLEVAALIWRTPLAAVPSLEGQKVDMQVRTVSKQLMWLWSSNCVMWSLKRSRDVGKKCGAEAA